MSSPRCRPLVIRSVRAGLEPTELAGHRCDSDYQRMEEARSDRHTTASGRARNNHNNYNQRMLALIFMRNAKSWSQHAVSVRCQRTVWVISWGLQFVWIIIRSITVNTSSDGAFTRNTPQYSISRWSLFHQIISPIYYWTAHFLIFLNGRLM